VSRPYLIKLLSAGVLPYPLWESVEGLVVIIVILLAAKVLVQVVAVHRHMNGTRRPGS